MTKKILKEKQNKQHLLRIKTLMPDCLITFQVKNKIIIFTIILKHIYDFSMVMIEIKHLCLYHMTYDPIFTHVEISDGHRKKCGPWTWWVQSRGVHRPLILSCLR